MPALFMGCLLVFLTVGTLGSLAFVDTPNTSSLDRLGGVIFAAITSAFAVGFIALFLKGSGEGQVGRHG